jgi:hypothetical protein
VTPLVLSLILAGAHAPPAVYAPQMAEPLPAGDPDPCAVARAADNQRELYDRLGPFAGWVDSADRHAAVAYGHWCWCGGRKELEADRPWWYGYTREVCYRHYAWHWLSKAASDDDSARVRLVFLDQLEEVIGPEAMAAGLMPPPVPGQRWSDE